ncbi:arabinosyltransferase domain-containing protein [Corynebacterium propinquum]|uniref:Arabinosyltransferase domain-containing protein n=1 Tax=Corynebacterium propinquum TaxID=43769 RepID=A0ABT7G2A6_9CORY|nr:arabinosyltransferase domain-containing protein [Corynebacterium propinquum]MDK4300862.1 arabinosyltransferase domain-containing protein [Corynebacterium propinquum]WKS32897.1 arabinosyltransferase domain-containing protein [Corynebacterium propinquum]WKS37285.1 arabinosyltransferase domain-containing protein [Corynebacterium propinquum]WKS39265.1 arabinosyltransferase domain-containing protein [Corynebacterium propinquum]WKS43395.1 arabinosyltransferase domain-containing protein [Corynebac
MSPQPLNPQAVGTEESAQRAASAQSASNPTAAARAHKLQLTAIITGVVGFLLFIATPLLPVNQTQSSFAWPQNGSLNSINAPLISVAPESFEATVPIAALDMLRDEQTLVLGTVPEDSTEASNRGLFVRSADGGLDVFALDEVLLSLQESEVAALADDALIEISVTADGTKVAVGKHSEKTEDDLRPQVTGIYSELEDTPENVAALTAAGLNVDVEINSRFTSTPTLAKSLAMGLGVFFMVVALIALARMDLLDGRKDLKVLPARWFKLRPLDGLVVAVLALWHVFGANTSDDGYILTMARVTEHAEYMANYYRWYGVPESPFGTPYYDLLALFAAVSTNSLWMRLPALLCGFAIWWVLSREILPRLGEMVNDRRVAHWTAALVFLAFWLPFNNGIRPEPFVALGVVLTWVSFERAIATQRLLPAAIGTFIATVTLAAGPTGLFAVGSFLIALPYLIRILRYRLQLLEGGTLAAAAMIAPFMAAGTMIMVMIFNNQTIATVLESTRVRGEVGPSLEWFFEFVRYQTLFEQTVDGSFTRRFGPVVMFACIALILYAFVRDRKMANGPALRLVLIVFVSLFFLMFTPTKWTHHFGIYAGIAAAIAALGAVVLSQVAVRSRRARVFSIAGVLFLLAFTLAGWNAWWYVSSFGIPWWDRTIQLRGIEATNVVLLLALLVLLVGVIYSFRTPKPERNTRWAGVMAAPIAVVSALAVALSLASFAKAFADQYPSYSVGKGNLQALTGDHCALADDALLETNTNDAFLTPVDGELGESLAAGQSRGFDPNGVPSEIEPDGGDSAAVGVIGDADSPTSAGAGSESTEETEDGNRADAGVNDSTIRLPFNLDYNRVPVLGSWADESEPQSAAELTTGWYQMPERRESAPLLVVSAAGRIAHHDINGIEQEGEELLLEYGTRGADGKVRNTKKVEMMDVGQRPDWRNLRFPLDEIPDDANVVRLVAEDYSLDPEDWIAVTPPRNPELEPVSQRFDSDTPALLDWSTAFQFPCQRPFDHYAGVTEIPEFRVLPDSDAQSQLGGFQDYYGGGAMATAEAVNWSYEIPGYLDGDWNRDWGAVHKYELRRDSAGNAPDKATIDYTEHTRSGLWHSSDMKIRDERS